MLPILLLAAAVEQPLNVPDLHQLVVYLLLLDRRQQILTLRILLPELGQQQFQFVVEVARSHCPTVHAEGCLQLLHCQIPDLRIRKEQRPKLVVPPRHFAEQLRLVPGALEEPLEDHEILFDALQNFVYFAVELASGGSLRQLGLLGPWVDEHPTGIDSSQLGWGPAVPRVLYFLFHFEELVVEFLMAAQGIGVFLGL